MLTCKQHMFPRHALQQIILQDYIHLQIVGADESPDEQLRSSRSPSETPDGSREFQGVNPDNSHRLFG